MSATKPLDSAKRRRRKSVAMSSSERCLGAGIFFSKGCTKETTSACRKSRRRGFSSMICECIDCVPLRGVMLFAVLPGVLLASCILDAMQIHGISARFVFGELSLGAPVLTLDALLVSCRTRLRVDREHLSDGDLRDAFAAFRCDAQDSERLVLRAGSKEHAVNLGQFTAFLDRVQRMVRRSAAGRGNYNAVAAAVTASSGGSARRKNDNGNNASSGAGGKVSSGGAAAALPSASHLALAAAQLEQTKQLARRLARQRHLAHQTGAASASTRDLRFGSLLGGTGEIAYDFGPQAKALQFFTIPRGCSGSWRWGFRRSGTFRAGMRSLSPPRALRHFSHSGPPAVVCASESTAAGRMEVTTRYASAGGRQRPALSCGTSGTKNNACTVLLYLV